MVIHLSPAVGAEHQPGQGVRFPDGIRAADDLASLLDQIEGLVVDDGLVGVLYDLPLGRIVENPLVGLVGFDGRSAIDRVAQILRAAQDVSDSPLFQS